MFTYTGPAGVWLLAGLRYWWVGLFGKEAIMLPDFSPDYIFPYVLDLLAPFGGLLETMGIIAVLGMALAVAIKSLRGG